MIIIITSKYFLVRIWSLDFFITNKNNIIIVTPWHLFFLYKKLLANIFFLIKMNCK